MLTHTYTIDLNLLEINFYFVKGNNFLSKKPETLKVSGFSILGFSLY